MLLGAARSITSTAGRQITNAILRGVLGPDGAGGEPCGGTERC
jgi:hypothetical protein